MSGSSTAAGSTLGVSAVAPATRDAAGFKAMAATEVGGVEKIGAIGAVFAKVDFQPLKGPKDKHKGSPDSGAVQPSVAYDDSDAGQTLMRTAAADKTSKLYWFVVTYPTGEGRGFGGRVFGFPENTDGADTIIMATPSVEICTDIVKIPAGA